jgi:hypothetical protein
MPSGHSSRSAMEIELSKLSTPRIFLVRMLVFLVLCALVMVVLYKQIIIAFFSASPIPVWRWSGIRPCWRRWRRSLAASAPGG